MGKDFRRVNILQNLFLFGKYLVTQQDGDSLEVQANHTNYMYHKSHQQQQNMLHLQANLCNHEKKHSKGKFLKNLEMENTQKLTI